MRELFLTPPREQRLPSIPKDKPVYRVLDERGFFGPDDTLHPPGSIVVLWDDPNLEMEPLNEMAKERLEKVADTQEESARKMADFNGRYFVAPRSKNDLLEAATEDARRVQSLTNPKGVSILGTKNKDVSERITQVGATEAPEVGAEKQNKRAKIETLV